MAKADDDIEPIVIAVTCMPDDLDFNGVIEAIKANESLSEAIRNFAAGIINGDSVQQPEEEQEEGHKDEDVQLADGEFPDFYQMIAECESREEWETLWQDPHKRS